MLCIMAVLAALAQPSFKPMIDRWRVRDASDAIATTLYLARAEAIRRGGRIVVERLAANCKQGGWGCGWRVYFDADSSGSFTANAAGDTLIQTFPALDGTAIKSSNSGLGQIKFDRWGMNTVGAGFTIYPSSGNDQSPATITLCIGSGGRIRTVAGAKCSS